jgi:two-component system phosphate regulon response regulator PhoB
MLRDEPLLAATPVVVVTRFDREVDRIVAFEAGVDDYVTKPFFARELAGRVRAVLRRSATGDGPHPEARVRRQGEVSLDRDTRLVMVGDRPVRLTPREFDLLAALMEEAGRVLSRDRLVELVWGDDSAAGHRSVDTHVKTIRRKLGEGRRYVETVRGVGYRFTER